mmetsp:Transcript_26745/g.61611  ORF Transcript_26745/g.61611 Transcript_26745/m.61611 type:complete len:344 (+) Transcript_26745:61-1092(+)
MLFPLSKSFCSSGLFQSGGSEPLKRRVWSVDQAGKDAKVSQLHELLTSKASYQKHLDMIAKQTEEGVRADAARTRTYRAHLQEIQDRVEEEAEERKRKMHEETLQYMRQRSRKDLERSQGFQTLQRDSAQHIRDMEERVRAKPPIWGEPPERESQDRRSQRAASMKNQHAQTRQYFRECKERKEHLAAEGSPYTSSPSRPLTNYERRRREGLDKLSRQLRDYDSFLNDVYTYHHTRVYDERRRVDDEHYDRTRRKLALTHSHSMSRSLEQARIREDIADIKERMRTRPRSYGGYVPVEKSDRRRREEEADLRGEETKPLSFSPTSAQPQDQRTLSPRTLGLVT